MVQPVLFYEALFVKTVNVWLKWVMLMATVEVDCLPIRLATLLT